VQLDKPKANLSERTAWFTYRGAYPVKALSWRNMILILVSPYRSI